WRRDCPSSARRARRWRRSPEEPQRLSIPSTPPPSRTASRASSQTRRGPRSSDGGAWNRADVSIGTPQPPERSSSIDTCASLESGTTGTAPSPRPMNVGVDASELQGRPTGTGRYLRSLLRVWSRTTEDRFFVYFNGPAPADPVLDHPRIVVRSTDEPVRGLWWQQAKLPSAAGTDGLDVFFSPAFTGPILLDVPRVTAIND